MLRLMKCKEFLVLLAVLSFAIAPGSALDFSSGDAEWTPESWLCSLNDELCEDAIKGPTYEGSIFDVIDDVLENHAADVQVRMFRYRIAKNEDDADFVAQEVRRLNDKVSDIETERKILSRELEAGTITTKEYASAIKAVERKEKYALKQAGEMSLVVEELKDEELGIGFEEISKRKDHDNKKEKEIVSGTEGKEKRGNGKGGESEQSESKKGSPAESGRRGSESNASESSGKDAGDSAGSSDAEGGESKHNVSESDGKESREAGSSDAGKGEGRHNVSESDGKSSGNGKGSSEDGKARSGGENNKSVNGKKEKSGKK